VQTRGELELYEASILRRRIEVLVERVLYEVSDEPTKVAAKFSWAWMAASRLALGRYCREVDVLGC
jgi:hypothetical protein